MHSSIAVPVHMSKVGGECMQETSRLEPHVHAYIAWHLRAFSVQGHSPVGSGHGGKKFRAGGYPLRNYILMPSLRLGIITLDRILIWAASLGKSESSWCLIFVFERLENREATLELSTS